MKQTKIDPRLHNLLFIFCLFGIAATVGFIFYCKLHGVLVDMETWLILAMFAAGTGLKFAPRSEPDERVGPSDRRHKKLREAECDESAEENQDE